MEVIFSGFGEKYRPSPGHPSGIKKDEDESRREQGASTQLKFSLKISVFKRLAILFSSYCPRLDLETVIFMVLTGILFPTATLTARRADSLVGGAAAFGPLGCVHLPVGYPV